MVILIGISVIVLIANPRDDDSKNSIQPAAKTGNAANGTQGQSGTETPEMVSHVPVVQVTAADISKAECTRDLPSIRRCLDDIDLAVNHYASERFERDWTAYAPVVEHIEQSQGSLFPEMRRAFAEKLDQNLELPGFSARCRGKNCRSLELRASLFSTKRNSLRFYSRFESELERLRFDIVEFSDTAGKTRFPFGLESPSDEQVLKWLEQPNDGWTGLDERSELPGYVRIRVGKRPPLTSARVREVFAFIERERGDFAIPFRDQPKHKFHEQFESYSEYASWQASESFRDHELSFAVVLVGPEKCAAIAKKNLPAGGWAVHSCASLGSSKALPPSDANRMDDALDSIAR
ncbi:MAG: hypothetical protein ACQEVA_17320 [Myxococcota bacterium]